MLQVNWPTAGQGTSQCGWHETKKHNWSSREGLSFYERSDLAAAQGVEFRNIHIPAAAAVRQGSKWQKAITKGTFHCTGS